LLRLRAASADAIAISPTTGSGRSAYVHPRTSCIEGLRKSKRVAKALGRNLDRDARERLTERCLRHTSAGAVVPGDRSKRPEPTLAPSSRKS